MTRGSQQRAQEIDDNMVRAVEFSNRIDDVMAVYKSIFVQKKKQRSQFPITMLCVIRKPPAATAPPPAASPASSVASSEEQQSCDLILFCICAVR